MELYLGENNNGSSCGGIPLFGRSVSQLKIRQGCVGHWPRFRRGGHVLPQGGAKRRGGGYCEENVRTTQGRKLRENALKLKESAHEALLF